MRKSTLVALGIVLLAFGSMIWLLGFYTDQVRFELETAGEWTRALKESGDVHARLGDQLKTLISDPRFSAGSFTGKMTSESMTERSRRNPPPTNTQFEAVCDATRDIDTHGRGQN